MSQPLEQDLFHWIYFFLFICLALTTDQLSFMNSEFYYETFVYSWCLIPFYTEDDLFFDQFTQLLFIQHPLCSRHCSSC